VLAIAHHRPPYRRSGPAHGHRRGRRAGALGRRARPARTGGARTGR
jgi:hypothetical protein